MPKTERRSEKAKKDYEKRRAQAMADGKEATFLTCPLCGINRPLKMWGKDTRFSVKPDYAIITVRKGGGRRIGFFRLEDRDVKLADLSEEYPEVWENLFENVTLLHDLLMKQWEKRSVEREDSQEGKIHKVRKRPEENGQKTNVTSMTSIKKDFKVLKEIADVLDMDVEE